MAAAVGSAAPASKMARVEDETINKLINSLIQPGVDQIEKNHPDIYNLSDKVIAQFDSYIEETMGSIKSEHPELDKDSLAKIKTGIKIALVGKFLKVHREINPVDLASFDHLYFEKEVTQVFAKLPPTVKVLSANSEYPLEPKKEYDGVDLKDRKIVIVTLLGPTHHDAIFSQHRVQTIIGVITRLQSWLAQLPAGYQVAFVNPQYSDKPSLGFREKGQGTNQVMWEHPFFKIKGSVPTLWYDTRFDAPDGSRGQIAPTFQKEVGAAIAYADCGYTSPVSAYIPQQAPGLGLEGIKKSSNVGTDWPTISLDLMLIGKLKKEGKIPPDVSSKAIKREMDADPSAFAKKCGYSSVEAMRADAGYATTLNGFYNLVARCIQTVAEERFFGSGEK